MRNRTWPTLCCLFAASTAWGLDEQAVLQEFQQAFPDVQFYRTGPRITTVYGAPFGFGDSPEQTAAGFVARYAEMLGADPADLEPLSRLADWRHTQPLMFEPDLGSYRFTLVYFSQFRDGLPVFRADVRLLVRNDPGSPLVLARSSLRNLGDFRPGPLPAVRYDRMEDAALEAFPELVNLTDPELVIWAGSGTIVAKPTLAVRFLADSGPPTESDYQKWLFVSDVRTGAVLYKESQVFNIDVVGNVEGKANVATSQPAGSLTYGCSDELPQAMPHIFVSIVGGATATADEFGNFTIPNPGTSPVTVRSEVSGLYFDVVDLSGSNNFVEEKNVTPPGNITLTHNDLPTPEYAAEVNAYVHANIVRDFVLAANPDYPVIAGQTGFELRVNAPNLCSAQYLGDAIIFGAGTSSCDNWAFADVVYHEYGHHVVQMGSTGQGEYGEGLGDSVAAVILDRPETPLGYLLDSNCDDYQRSAENDCLYQVTGCSTCGAAFHDCGQLLSGCVWSTRNELVASQTPNYQELLGNLLINSVLAHGPTSSIDPSIFIHWLTLDDDNADISDGTPNYNAIYCGFAAHRMIACGFRKGDMNCDTLVNGADIDPFFLALGDPGAYNTAYPDCNFINADANGDGRVNGGDIDAFFGCLGTGNCCPCPGQSPCVFFDPWPCK